MKQLTEQEVTQLLQQIEKGDESAFRMLFDTYYKYLTVIAYRYLNDGEKARDLAQDVFLDIWNRRAELQINYEIKAYLRRAVINKSLNYLKREKRIDFSENEKLPDSPIAPQAALEVEAADLKKIIQQCIDQLPARCRIIFCMSRFEEKSHKEIASHLGISTKTIENQITRALKSIRKTLASYKLSMILLFLQNLFFL